MNDPGCAHGTLGDETDPNIPRAWLQAQLHEMKAQHAAAAIEASTAKQGLADRELLLAAAAPANGDMGEDVVCPSLWHHASACRSAECSLFQRV